MESPPLPTHSDALVSAPSPAEETSLHISLPVHPPRPSLRHRHARRSPSRASGHEHFYRRPPSPRSGDRPRSLPLRRRPPPAPLYAPVTLPSAPSPASRSSRFTPCVQPRMRLVITGSAWQNTVIGEVIPLVGGSPPSRGTPGDPRARAASPRGPPPRPDRRYAQ